jgi:hypothetical protein
MIYSKLFVKLWMRSENKRQRRETNASINGEMLHMLYIVNISIQNMCRKVSFVYTSMRIKV